MRPTSLNATTLPLLLGDIFVFAISLILALTIREFAIPEASFLFEHTIPFLLLLIVWLAIFLIGGMYDQTYLRVKQSIGSTLFILQVFGTFAAVLMFYLLSGLVVTPKTNLALFVIIFTTLIWIWRKVFFTKIHPSTQAACYIGEPENKPSYLEHDNMLGISLIQSVGWSDVPDPIDMITTSVIVDTQSPEFKTHSKQIREMVFHGVRLIDLKNLNERVSGMVDLESVENSWALDHLELPTRFYLFFKRTIDILSALVLLVILCVVIPFVAMGQLFTEKRVSLFFAQKRIGARGRVFTMYKLRSMSVADGETWSTENHTRITPVGHIIRSLRIDELPQAINLLRGEMSLVGPRALLPSEQLSMQEHSPLYRLRLFATPGITGWAQISMDCAPANKEEALQRLGYDLYYIKHSSVLFDILIILKTIKTIIQKTGIRPSLAKKASVS